MRISLRRSSLRLILALLLHDINSRTNNGAMDSEDITKTMTYGDITDTRTLRTLCTWDISTCAAHELKSNM